VWEGTEGRKGREMEREVKGEGREERRGRGRDIPVPDWESEKVATLTDRRQTDPFPRNMTQISIEKYCQFIIIFTKYRGNIITYIPPRIWGTVPMPPP